MGKWHHEIFQTPDSKVGTEFSKLKKIWDSNADIKLKYFLQCISFFKFFNASVLSILLYVTGSYLIVTTLQNKINAFPDTMPMNHANISKEDKVINEHVHKLTDTPPLTKRVTKSKLSFLGHSIRKSKDGPIQ